MVASHSALHRRRHRDSVNTALFSVADAVLICPLPYASPARLVRIEETTSKRPNIGITAAEYLQWRERADLFGATAAYVRYMVTVGDEAPDQVWMVRATGGLFPMLGTPPRIGRAPSETKDDRLYQRICDDLDALLKAVGLKVAA